MKIRYVHGNLLDAAETVIIHGCNMQGKMNSGVARYVREKYPKAYEYYMVKHHAHGLQLGEIVWSPQTTHECHLVGNAITQEYYGREQGTRYVSYDAICCVIEQIDDIARNGDFGYNPAVAMPLIGAGLAQGKWSIISKIIETYSVNFEPVVYLIDGEIPDV